MNALIQSEAFMETAVRLLAHDIPSTGWLDYAQLTDLENTAVNRLVEAGLVVAHFDITFIQQRRWRSDRKVAFYFKGTGRKVQNACLERIKGIASRQGFTGKAEARAALGIEGLFAQLSKHGAVARADLLNRKNLSFVYDWIQHKTAETEFFEVDGLEPLLSRPTSKQQTGDRGINLIAMPGSTISNINTGDITHQIDHHFYDAVESTSKPKTPAKTGGNDPLEPVLPFEIADALAHRPTLKRLAEFMWNRISADATDLVPHVHAEHRSASALSTAANDLNNILERAKSPRCLGTKKETIYWKKT